MKDALSCRESFTATLIDLAKKDPRIVALSSDARGSTSLSGFAAALPEQYIETGIAEQDEIGIAAGLALVGKHPYVSAPASFLSARSLEQVKVDVAYAKTNVKIFAVSGGVSYGALGATHHSLHDIAVMRAFPSLTVILPCDQRQTEAAIRAVEKKDMPVYFRVGKQALTTVYEKDAPFQIGKANLLREGKDITIIACGETVAHAVQAAGLLAEEGIDVRVLDMHTLKPLDDDAVVRAAKETGAIVTVEEHHIFGGLGAAVAQVTAAHCPVPVLQLALPDEDTIAGKPVEVFAHYGIDADGIVRAVKGRLVR